MLELNIEYTYKQICEAVGWEVSAGNSKKAQIKEIESATEWHHPINNKTHKEKKSYIFTKQLREFVEPQHGGVRNTKFIQPMMDYLMMKAEPDAAYKSITAWLCDELLLMKKNTYNIPYTDKDEIESFCKKYHITNIKLFCDYTSSAKAIMKRMFIGALLSMKKQGLVEYEDGYMFTYRIGRRSKGHFATDIFNEIIKENETEICNTLQWEHGLTEKLSGRQLLLIIYGSKSYTEQFNDMKLSALMENTDTVEIMNKCIDNIATDVGAVCGRKYIDEECPLLSYYRGIAVQGIESRDYQDGIAMEICNIVRKKTRKVILNKHYKNKYTGQVVYPYDKSKCAAEMAIIEKLLFEFYDKNLVEDTAPDLAESDEDLDELFKVLQTAAYIEPDPIDNPFTIEEILEMPAVTNVIA